MELAPEVHEAVHYFIEELAGIEADLQLEDLIFFCKKSLEFLNIFDTRQAVTKR